MKIKVGDPVRWHLDARHVNIGIVETHIKDADYKEHMHHASDDVPKYEINSDKTARIAMHKWTTLEKTARTLWEFDR